MSRISLLLVAASVAAGVVGCAQCDTCDDFPAPCTGPNCGQNRAGVLDYMPPGPGQPAGSGAPPSSAPGGTPMNDSAGPAPTAPASEPAPVPASPPTPNPNMPPTVSLDPSSAPSAMELGNRP
jgi:hypothetical protein